LATIPLGVMVDRGTIRTALTGRTPDENIRLYAREAPCPVCFFSFSGLDPARGMVRAYVYNAKGRLIRRHTALPKAIHYRTIAFSQHDRRLATYLARRRGSRLYNHPRVSGKLWHCRWLSADPELHERVPETARYAGARSLHAMLSRHDAVVLKRVWGSLGIGMLRVRREGDAFVWEKGTGRIRRCLNLTGAAAQLRHQTAGRRYLIQQWLDLARYHGHRFDLRCVVQRDGTGAWRFVGACLRLSGQNRLATNLARGARALKPLPILREVFGEEADAKYADLERFAIQVATVLASHERRLADLGIDAAFSTDGRLWFIEANSRATRHVFNRSLQWDAYRESFRLPMEYGHALVRRRVD
jgi:hypothetical protein